MSEHAHSLAKLYFHAELVHHVVADHHSRRYVKDSETRLVAHLTRCPDGRAEHEGLTMQMHTVSIEGKVSHYVKFTGSFPMHDHSTVSIRAGMKWKRGSDLVKVDIGAEHVKRVTNKLRKEAVAHR